MRAAAKSAPAKAKPAANSRTPSRGATPKAGGPKASGVRVSPARQVSATRGSAKAKGKAKAKAAPVVLEDFQARKTSVVGSEASDWQEDIEELVVTGAPRGSVSLYSAPLVVSGQQMVDKRSTYVAKVEEARQLRREILHNDQHDDNDDEDDEDEDEYEELETLDVIHRKSDTHITDELESVEPLIDAQPSFELDLENATEITSTTVTPVLTYTRVPTGGDPFEEIPHSGASTPQEPQGAKIRWSKHGSFMSDDDESDGTSGYLTPRSGPKPKDGQSSKEDVSDMEDLQQAEHGVKDTSTGGTSKATSFGSAVKKKGAALLLAGLKSGEVGRLIDVQESQEEPAKTKPEPTEATDKKKGARLLLAGLKSGEVGRLLDVQEQHDNSGNRDEQASSQSLAKTAGNQSTATQGGSTAGDTASTTSTASSAVWTGSAPVESGDKASIAAQSSLPQDDTNSAPASPGSQPALLQEGQDNQMQLTVLQKLVEDLEKKHTSIQDGLVQELEHEKHLRDGLVQELEHEKHLREEEVRRSQDISNELCAALEMERQQRVREDQQRGKWLETRLNETEDKWRSQVESLQLEVERLRRKSRQSEEEAAAAAAVAAHAQAQAAAASAAAAAAAAAATVASAARPEVRLPPQSPEEKAFCAIYVRARVTDVARRHPDYELPFPDQMFHQEHSHEMEIRKGDAPTWKNPPRAPDEGVEEPNILQDAPVECKLTRRSLLFKKHDSDDDLPLAPAEAHEANDETMRLHHSTTGDLETSVSVLPSFPETESMVSEVMSLAPSHTLSPTPSTMIGQHFPDSAVLPPSMSDLTDRTDRSNRGYFNRTEMGDQYEERRHEVLLLDVPERETDTSLNQSSRILDTKGAQAKGGSQDNGHILLPAPTSRTVSKPDNNRMASMPNVRVVPPAQANPGSQLGSPGMSHRSPGNPGLMVPTAAMNPSSSVPHMVPSLGLNSQRLQSTTPTYPRHMTPPASQQILPCPTGSGHGLRVGGQGVSPMNSGYWPPPGVSSPATARGSPRQHRALPMSLQPDKMQVGCLSPRSPAVIPPSHGHIHCGSHVAWGGWMHQGQRADDDGQQSPRMQLAMGSPASAARCGQVTRQMSSASNSMMSVPDQVCDRYPAMLSEPVAKSTGSQASVHGSRSRTPGALPSHSAQMQLRAPIREGLNSGSSAHFAWPAPGAVLADVGSSLPRRGNGMEVPGTPTGSWRLPGGFPTPPLVSRPSSVPPGARMEHMEMINHTGSPYGGCITQHAPPMACPPAYRGMMQMG